MDRIERFILLFLVLGLLLLGARAQKYKIRGYTPPVFRYGGGGEKVPQEVTAGKGMNCTTFDSPEDVPEGWQIVESCNLWYKMVEANQTINEVGKVTGETKGLLEKAKQEYGRGNYTGAEKLAELAKKKAKEQGFPFLPMIIALVLIIGGSAGGYFFLMRSRKKRIVAEIQKANSEIKRIMREVQNQISRRGDAWRIYQRLRQLIQESRRLARNYKRIGYKRSSSRLRAIERELRRLLRNLRQRYGVRVAYRKYRGISGIEKFRIKAELKLIKYIRLIKIKIKGLIDSIQNLI